MKVKYILQVSKNLIFNTLCPNLLIYLLLVWGLSLEVQKLNAEKVQDKENHNLHIESPRPKAC